MASLKTGEHVGLGITGAQPLGMAGGVLTYVTSAGVIMGVPFDARKKKLIGSASAARERRRDQQHVGARAGVARRERNAVLSERDAVVRR